VGESAALLKANMAAPGDRAFAERSLAALGRARRRRIRKTRKALKQLEAARGCGVMQPRNRGGLSP
jgi:hypothetical protein